MSISLLKTFWFHPAILRGRLQCSQRRVNTGSQRKIRDANLLRVILAVVIYCTLLIGVVNRAANSFAS